MIGKESLNSLSLGIKNMTNIKRLSLNFWKCYSLDDNGFRKLSQNLFHHLLRLEQLTINCELCTYITDHALATFSKDLSKNVLSLRSLTLIFIKCDKISDKGTIALLTGLDRYSINLQKLSLNLSGCYKVTDRTLRFFNNGSECHRLGNLEQLTLNLSWNNQITDKGMEEFAEGISHYCSKLNLLNLNFSACGNGISDIGFLAVGSKTVQSLKKLEKIFLNFGSCFKITSQALEKVAEDIKIYLPNMKHLKLSLIGCSKIDAAKKKEIKLSLKDIPVLELI